MQHAVIAILSGHEQSIRCAEALKRAGFTRDEISILLPDDFGAQELSFSRRTKALEGFAVGAVAGGIFGAIVGYIAADLHLYIPGLTSAIAAGHLAASATVAAIVGALLAVLCSLVGMSTSEYYINKFDRKTRHKSSLMSVHVDNSKEMRMAQKVLKNEGAFDVRCTEELTDRKKPVAVSAH